MNRNEYLKNKNIIYVSNTTVKFKNALLNKIRLTCESAKDIRQLLERHRIPKELITNMRVSGLRKRYISNQLRNIKMEKLNQKTIEKLIRNDNIVNATASSVFYTYEFKYEVAKAKSLTEARKVFEEAQINIDDIGESRFEKAYYRFKHTLKTKGKSGLINEQRGRRKSITVEQNMSKMSDSEKIKYLEARNKELEEEIEFQKKYKTLLQNSGCSKSKYIAIREIHIKEKYPLARLMKYFKVKQAAYYNYFRRINPVKIELEAEILEQIKEIIKKYPKNKSRGYRQISMALDTKREKENQSKVNHKRVLRIMRENDLLSKIRKNNPYKNIMKKGPEDKTSKNTLNRDFTTGKPGEKYLTDITYLNYKAGTAYLSAVKDCVTREIVAYVIRGSLGIKLSLDIVKQLEGKIIPNKTLIHSDQGAHYTSIQFRDLVAKSKLVQSMSRKGNCIDNAPMESFFGHMKDEVEFKSSETLEDVIKVVSEYIEEYNHERKQWGLKKMTPEQYKNHLLNQEQATI